MKTLDFFEDLDTTFDFVPVADLEIEAAIERIVGTSRDLHQQINNLEKQVKVIEDDIELLASLGSQLQRDESRERVKEFTEEFLLETNVTELRCKLAELYGARQSIAKAVSKLAVFDESVNTTCSVCLERTVEVFNANCGHTACESCASKVTRCPYCRSAASFRKIVFSS